MKAVAMFLQQYQAIVAVLIAVSGWVISHLLAIRSQRKAFLDKVINDARLDLVASTRNCQDWLGSLWSGIAFLEFQIQIDRPPLPQHWVRRRADFAQRLHEERSFTWLQRLEEYEILFPDTRAVRIDLLNRQRHIRDVAQEMIDQLDVGQGERQEAVTRAQLLREPIFDLIALIEDLRIYLQNRCLGQIAGSQIPQREPISPNSLRIVRGDDGQLAIVTN